MSDAIGRSIAEALSDARIAGIAGVEITVSEDVIAICGHVPTLRHKQLIEQAVARAAGRAHGVVAVVNQLQVRPGFERDVSRRTDDAELARAAVRTLRANGLLRAAGISATVRNGWVTLAGCVEWEYQKRAASYCVRLLDGVRGVTNELKLSDQAPVFARNLGPGDLPDPSAAA